MTEPAMTRTLELVKKARGGDRDALNRLFARYPNGCAARCAPASAHGCASTSSRATS